MSPRAADVTPRPRHPLGWRSLPSQERKAGCSFLLLSRLLFNVLFHVPTSAVCAIPHQCCLCYSPPVLFVLFPTSAVCAIPHQCCLCYSHQTGGVCVFVLALVVSFSACHEGAGAACLAILARLSSCAANWRFPSVSPAPKIVPKNNVFI